MPNGIIIHGNQLITSRSKRRSGGQNIFGLIKGEQVEEAIIELNETGQALDQCLKEIPKFYPNESLVVKAVQVMPDHAHLVLKVERMLGKTTLGRIISGVKAGVRHLAPKSESASIRQMIVEEKPTMVRLTEADLRQKAENKHFAYSPLPTDSLRYRYVALNNIAKLVCEP